jgi:hypothetical protein
MDHATVVSVEVGPSSVGAEPLTTAVLRDDEGRLVTVKILGGPNEKGGVTRLAGYVWPMPGMRVRADLREEPPAPGNLAWTASGPKWPVSAFPLSFYLGLPESRDVGLQAGGEIEVAARAWSTVSCTSYRAGFAGTTMDAPALDGKNVVYFHDTIWPAELTPKALAQTVLHTDASNDIVDADIHINGKDYLWSLQGSGASPDLRSILTHELGHALGLNHSTTIGATMWATYGGNTAWRSLEKDDRDGVCALYPGTGAPGCDQNPCPMGFLCVANQCERNGALATVCSPCDPSDVQACVGAGDDARCVDIGAGARVCGRACASDADCGNGFHCKPTTTSGDLQCLSDTGCRNGPDACSKDADCKIGSCKGGVCVGMAAPPDAGPDAADAGPAPPTTASGCHCNATSSTTTDAWLMAFSLMLLRARRRR